MRDRGQDFEAHDRAWRDPADVIAEWSDASEVEPELLRFRARGDWWDVLAECEVTLVVTREYEHLVLAIESTPRPRVSHLRLQHPSGTAFDPARNRLFIATTRNPNRILEFAPTTSPTAGVLVPTRSWYFPGSTYLHDLAFIGGKLHANAVGQNAIVAIDEDGCKPVWWPRSLESNGRPTIDRNYIQLNSIAAGTNLESSFFSASSERAGRFRPGQARYPVDRQGVIFSGSTREPMLRGLTRPHSARFLHDQVWVANSGYGELGFARDGRFEVVAKLPGWTRGLAFTRNVAFVGTSRVIPRFAHYAPGIDADKSRCSIVAFDVVAGKVRGSLEFPAGNQIFAIEPLPAAKVAGFPFAGAQRRAAERELFFRYAT